MTPTEPTWADCTFPDPKTGAHVLRFRFAALASPDPTDPLATSIYPVGADGENLTRSPIIVRTRAWIGYPLPSRIGRDGDVCELPENFWQPYTEKDDHDDE